MPFSLCNCSWELGDKYQAILLMIFHLESEHILPRLGNNDIHMFLSTLPCCRYEELFLICNKKYYLI